MSPAPAALELAGIRKRFGQVVALDTVSLTVRTGTIHALLGENGAGKTTLMRIAFGLVAPNDGTVRVHGARIATSSPAHAIRSGLGMVQQHFALVPALSVRENIALGVSAGRRLQPETEALAVTLGISDLDTPVANLSVSAQQRIEIVKALARGANVLILDEPTSALAPGDAEELFAWLKGFRSAGGSVVFITHRLQDALALADDVTVLREGRVVWTGTKHAASADVLVSAMLGDDSRVRREGGVTRRGIAKEQLVVDATALSISDDRGVTRVTGADLRIRAGEVVGVAAVDGSGHRELLLALAGRLAPQSGSLRVPDRIGFVPDDRLSEGLLPDLSIVDNVSLKGAGRRRGWFTRSSAEAVADRLVRDFGIRATDIHAAVATLSGGNQQRLIVARELEGTPGLIVAINPTRGLDVAAADEVRQRLQAAADSGSAVVLHSADLDELLAIADRMIVVFNGQVRDVARDRTAVGRAMLGVA